MTHAGAGPGTDPTMQELSADECLALLGTQEIGRLGVVADHYPLVVPVNYRLDGSTVVIRTHAGTVLRAAEHANVTFEVDQIDRASHGGWSVLVRGSAEEVGTAHRAEIVERTRDSGVEPWAPGDKDHWIRVIAHQVTGRRILPGTLRSLDPRGYL